MPATPIQLIPFIDRENQLATLDKALNVVLNAHKSRFILVSGDKGMGKTTLVQHFLSEVSRQDLPVTIGQAECAIQDPSLTAFSQLLLSLTKQSVERKLIGNLFDFVKEVAPAWLDILTLGTASKIVEAGAKTIEEGNKLFGRNAYTADNIRVQFTNAIYQLAEKQPVIAFIDDLQWADTSSLGLLHYLGRHLGDRPILFICAHRPVAIAEAPLLNQIYNEVAGIVEIKITQSINVLKYAALRYTPNSFPENFISTVQDITGGNPLFVDQLFLFLESEGVIRAESADGFTKWNLEQGIDLAAIPQEFTNVLEQRLHLIDNDLREILTIASVEGQDFTAQVVSQLRQLDEITTSEKLRVLEQHYNLIQSLQPETTYSLSTIALDFYQFIQRFFREHLYNQLIKDNPKKGSILHRQVGECLEKLYEDRRLIAGQLARHFSEARDPMKAAKYALMAAQVEQHRYAWSDIAQWCEFGLAQINKIPSAVESVQLRLDLLEQLATSYDRLGKYSIAIQKYHEALELAENINADIIRRANLCERLAYIYEYENEYDEVQKYIDRANQLFSQKSTGLGEVQLKIESLEALMQSRMGTSSQSIESFRRILAEADSLPSTPALDYAKAQSYSWLAIALSDQGQYSEAHTANQAAIELCRKTESGQLEQACLLNMADDLIKAGDYNQSSNMVDRAFTLAQQIGDLDGVAYSRAVRGNLLLSSGKLMEAIRELTDAIELSEQIESLWNMGYMYADLALAHLGLNEIDLAYQEAARATSSAEVASHLAYGYALDVLAQVEVARQDWDSAERHFFQSIEIHRAAGNEHFVARTQRHLAEAQLKRGQYQPAQELLKTALVVFKKLKLPQEIEATQRLIEAKSA